MNATFNPVKGFKVELSYSREVIASAIATQVSLWVNGIASSFLGLCELTVSKGHQTRAHVNGKVMQAREVSRERLTQATTQANELAVDLAIATLRRIKRPILGLVLPPLNTMVERYLGVRNTVQSALIAYIEGAAEPIPLSLPSVEAALAEQEVLVPKSDGEGLVEAENTNPVAQEEEESQSVPLSDERPKALDGAQQNGEDTGGATPKRRGKGRSA